MTTALSGLSDDGVDLLVLACFDHTQDDLDRARRSIRPPVVSTRALAAAALAGLFT